MYTRSGSTPLSDVLFDRHYRELCLYATHFTSDIDAAEDIVPMIEQVLDVKVAVDE